MRAAIRDLIEAGEARFKEHVASLMNLYPTLSPHRQDELRAALDELLGKIRENGAKAKKETQKIQKEA